MQIELENKPSKNEITCDIVKHIYEYYIYIYTRVYILRVYVYTWSWRTCRSYVSIEVIWLTGPRCPNVLWSAPFTRTCALIRITSCITKCLDSFSTLVTTDEKIKKFDKSHRYLKKTHVWAVIVLSLIFFTRTRMLFWSMWNCIWNSCPRRNGNEPSVSSFPQPKFRLALRITWSASNVQGILLQIKLVPLILQTIKI